MDKDRIADIWGARTRIMVARPPRRGDLADERPALGGNNREAGCGPALPGFRNWDNPEHVRELAGLWNVDPIVIPHWAPPTNAMAMFHYAEQGSIGFLWIAGTDPAVSMPTWPVSGASCPADSASWWSPMATAPRPPNWPTWCCRRRCGGRRGRIRAVALRQLSRHRRQRADPHRLGSRLETAGVQGRRGLRSAGPGRRRAGPGAHHY
jgi:hypothetical protein